MAKAKNSESENLSELNNSPTNLVSANINDSNWGRMRRMEFIDYRLFVSATINRSALIKFFNISVPQASLDLTYYRELVSKSLPARENLYYDRHKKVYLRSEDFKPVFDKYLHADSILSDLELLSKDCLDPSRNFFSNGISVSSSVLKPLNRNIDIKMLINLIDAVCNHKALHVVYLSVSSVAYDDYLIAPHSFVFDGFRWHIRAYCYDKHEFRDYVISRIKKTDEPKVFAPNDRFPDPIGNGFREVGVDSESDSEWNNFAVLRLKINPALPEATRKALELDYGFDESGIIEYKVRVAMLFYAVRNLKVSKEYKALPDVERHLVLENEKEIYALLGD